MADGHLIAAAARAAEAVAAVDRLVAARHERDAGHATARVADGLVHLARATIAIVTAGVAVAAATTAIAATRLAGGAALGAAAGGIGPPARGVELLLAGRPAERVATIAAGARLIGIGHRRFDSLLVR